MKVVITIDDFILYHCIVGQCLGHVEQNKKYLRRKRKAKLSMVVMTYTLLVKKIENCTGLVIS
jgi:hypothetical protein